MDFRLCIKSIHVNVDYNIGVGVEKTAMNAIPKIIGREMRKETKNIGRCIFVTF